MGSAEDQRVQLEQIPQLPHGEHVDGSRHEGVDERIAREEILEHPIVEHVARSVGGTAWTG
jgi:hypothetical protein